MKALESEVRALRDAIFESKEWAPFVKMWRKLLNKEKNGDNDAIERSIMSRIAQELEDKCLCAMVAQLTEDGWHVLALVYDGCIVRDRPECVIDLEVIKRLENRVLKDEGLHMIIEEKELFAAEPKLSLARNMD